MGADMYGLGIYLVSLITMSGIYAVMALGLNLQWGMGGLFNAGVVGFFAVGAYTAAIFSSPPVAARLGGFALPVPIGVVAGMLLAGVLGYLVGRICIRLKSDYLAIATIGIAEVLRLVIRNESWLTNGSLGIRSIPRPFDWLPAPWSDIGFALAIVLIVAALYVFNQRAQRVPWGRTMRAIRDNEQAAMALGKNVNAYRLQAFALGSAVMGLGGALTAHYFRYLGPDALEPLLTTFLVWVMLIVGGSGNNRGAILGAVVIWVLWSATELLAGQLPSDWASRLSYVRVLMVGLLLQLVLQRFPAGLIPERADRLVDRQDRSSEK